MKCPKCGRFMERLVTASEELVYDSNDETIRKTTTEIYEQCKRERCGYSETINVEVKEEKLPFQVVH